MAHSLAQEKFQTAEILFELIGSFYLNHVKYIQS